MNKNFKFIPSPYEGGQITDSKPGQKFEDKFDPIFECTELDMLYLEQTTTRWIAQQLS